MKNKSGRRAIVDQRVSAKVGREITVIGERVLDRIRLTSYWNTKPRREKVAVTLLAKEVPPEPFDALRFVHAKAYGGAWPWPPSHREAEAFRDVALKLCI